MTKTQEKTPETQNFSADVARLLEIVAGALYNSHDIFLRELISNAADACDRLRYDAIQNPDLIENDPEFRIHVFKNTENRTLSIFDNGIGMSAAELKDNLGTIAKSGTAKIMEAMKAKGTNSDENLKLIGQFGVGFYASYMVASHVRVISRKAGGKTANVWESNGKTGFKVRKATKEEAEQLHGERGTLITLDIKDEAAEFLIDDKLRQVIEQYSDHIDIPVYLIEPEYKEGQTPANKASALWMRPRDQITKEQYTEFYKHISFGFDEPLLTSHWRAEGKIEFTALLFLPTMRPWDLYDPGRKNAVRLYVRRVFISDSIPDLMYPWLRFVRGVIDSEDLPLNISRESLQYNPLITTIRSSVARKVLNDLDKLSRDDTPAFESFWHQFGSALKEGLYDAAEHREGIFKICRFFSTHENGEKLTSLSDYTERMPEDQSEIYYISGESVESLKHSPQLEGFKARGLEVLFFTDTIDDFWLQQVQDYKGKAFKSITKGTVDFEKFESQKEEDGNQKSEKEKEKDHTKIEDLITNMKNVLKEELDDVRISARLTDSPVCLVVPEHGVDMHMEQTLKLHQKYEGGGKPVLELNPDHPAIEKIASLPASSLSDYSYALYDLAHILQGMRIKDPSRFSRLFSELMEKAA